MSDDKRKPTGEAQPPPKGAPTDAPASRVGPEPANPPVPGPAPTTAKPPAAQSTTAAPPPGPPPKPEPKNPGMVTVTIDGTEVAVKPGTNMVEAAKQVGSEIPYYCYHPRLSIAANCRMCLVEVSNAPKLVPACQTPLAEGQVIKTTTPKVKEQQRAVMEFLLLNHPVDCAICDQAGECKLQDYYMSFDAQPSRLEGGKVMKSKRKELGPLVTLDQERCILCSRCVRFMSEVAQQPQLGIFGRGSHEVVDTFPDQQLESNYSGNIVDICPVGALTNRDFRFRARAWFLSATPSVCTGCSRGCSTYADHHRQDTYRYRPRENESINKSWMCDKGRLSYKALNNDRVDAARVGRGDVREVTPAEAVQAAAERLRPLAGQKGLAVLASPVASNEDLLAALSLAKDVLEVQRVYVGGRPQGEADHYLLTADRNPNRQGLEWIARGLGLELGTFDELSQAVERGQVKALFAVGTEVPGSPEAFAERLMRLETVVVQAQNVSPLLAAAHVVLPASVHVEDEGSFTQQDGITQRVRKAYPPREHALPHWRWAGDLARALGAEVAFASARDVFRALSPRVPELASFDWDKQAPSNTARGGINPIPTGADGRPPGYREFGASRVRGI